MQAVAPSTWEEKAVNYAALTQHLHRVIHHRKKQKIEGSRNTARNQQQPSSHSANPNFAPQSNGSGRQLELSNNEGESSMRETVEVKVCDSALMEGGSCGVRDEDHGESFQKLLLAEINKVRQFLSFKKKELKQKLLHLRRSFNNIVFWWESGFPDLEVHLDEIHEQFTGLGNEVAQLLKFIESNVALVRKTLAKYDAATGHLAGSSMLLQYKGVLEELADTEDFVQLVAKVSARLLDLWWNCAKVLEVAAEVNV